MKLSVVIPVYRVASTLDRCVESVLRQQVEQMEVILVDDGSPDECPRLCDQWAERDPRILVIHRQNGGLSAARNSGIAAATGNCITFVDSDDWVAANTYPAVLDAMGDADIVEYPIAQRLTLADKTYQSTDSYWLQSQAYTHTYAWNKVYRRCLFDSIRYPEGRVFEDAYTLPLLLHKARKVVTTSKGCYHYCWNPDGITARADGLQLAQLLEAHLQGGMPMDDLYYMHLLNIQMDVWEQTGQPLLLPQRHVNSAQLQGGKRLKAIMLNKLGIKTLCRINKLTHYFRMPSRW